MLLHWIDSLVDFDWKNIGSVRSKTWSYCCSCCYYYMLAVDSAAATVVSFDKLDFRRNHIAAAVPVAVPVAVCVVDDVDVCC